MLAIKQAEPTFIIPVSCIERVERVSIQLNKSHTKDRKYLNNQFEIFLKPE